jgi:N-methylhydantoinase B/oxoprolinase/acetone carboxylase alpha subunit
VLTRGDGRLVEVGGGGGVGSPLERDVERVLADVRSGYVSLGAAAENTGRSSIRTIVAIRSTRKPPKHCERGEEIRHDEYGYVGSRR